MRCFGWDKKETYSKEFKEEAVALVHDQGCSVTDAAKSLGIASNILYRWKQNIEDKKQGEDEREELKSLHKEFTNGERNTTCALWVKKASAFFAKEMK
ncbi:MAG: transposase [Gammaproteobacteria bacterium]|nr:transposase [Gammaproteobacteria bacterium]